MKTFRKWGVPVISKMCSWVLWKTLSNYWNQKECGGNLQFVTKLNRCCGLFGDPLLTELKCRTPSCQRIGQCVEKNPHIWCQRYCECKSKTQCLFPRYVYIGKLDNVPLSSLGLLNYFSFLLLLVDNFKWPTNSFYCL